jgi:hypothetical protein
MAVSRRKRLGRDARRVIVVLVLVMVFLPFGVPRWFSADDNLPPSPADDDAKFAKVCRDHGGTPATRPPSGTQPQAQRACSVRYGRTVYLMDAITPDGFDQDTARFQRQGCEEAARQEKSSAPRRQRRRFVYHADTGVCEHRP